MMENEGFSAERSDNTPDHLASRPTIPPTVFSGASSTNMPVQLGRYRFIRKLGKGGMGTVYLVENTDLQRKEALKIPQLVTTDDTTVHKRFILEARALARLRHPNLCPIYHADVIDNVFFMTMCYLEGKPLSEYVGKPMTVHDAIDIVVKLAGALVQAHKEGVIHRDLKPSNVMMCPEVGPTVMDFGLAKLTQQTDLNLTQSGTTMGTPMYMPPEQVRGDKQQIGPATDIYSLGVILFELLTGRPPFTGTTTSAVLASILLDNHPQPSELRPGLSPALDAVCARALNKEPAKRYPSMQAFAAALMDLRGTLPATEIPSLYPTPDRRPDSETLPSAPGSFPFVDATEPKKLSATNVDEMPGTGAGRRRTLSRRGAYMAGACAVLLLTAGLFVAMRFLPPGPSERSASTENQGTEQKDGGKTAKAAGENGQGKDMKGTADAFVNDIGMTLVRIPAGTFTMGAPENEGGRKADSKESKEERQHLVEISSFQLGTHEVTQKQFRRVMAYNPSHFSKNARGKDGVEYGAAPGGGRNKFPADEDTEDYPVENVSWDEAKEFCTRLTALDTKKPDGHEYRLPTEAEWEYACRGNNPVYQVFHFGDSLSFGQANFDSTFPFGGGNKGKALNRPCTTGSYEKNRFGLYDMHGNVWEWCADWYDENYYKDKTGRQKDPQGPVEKRTARVIRGGSFDMIGTGCRSASRSRFTATDRDANIGFRVALAATMN